jgi:hypothetical protein
MGKSEERKKYLLVESRQGINNLSLAKMPLVLAVLLWEDCLDFRLDVLD